VVFYTPYTIGFFQIGHCNSLCDKMCAYQRSMRIGFLNIGRIYKDVIYSEIGALRHRHRFAGLQSALPISDRVGGSDLLIFRRPSGIRVEPGRQ
jgi:hypothetical protein